MFYGIIVKMDYKYLEPYRKPHIQGWHADRQASFDIGTGEVIAGSMDADDEAMVRAWIKIHREELFANWKLLSEERTFFKVEPLR